MDSESAKDIVNGEVALGVTRPTAPLLPNGA
jgi:hypothetical protein